MADNFFDRFPEPAADEKPIAPGTNFFDTPGRPGVGIPPKPATISPSRAMGEGYLTGASAGWSDEVKGLGAASGLPDWMGGYRAPSGAVKILGERQLPIKGDNAADVPAAEFTPLPGDAEKRYIETRNASRDFAGQAETQQPGAFFGGSALGAAVMPTGRLRAASAIGRGFESLGKGALYGGITGAGESDNTQDMPIRAGIGSAVGAAASAVPPVIGAGYRYVSSPFRGWANPEQESYRRLGQAFQADAGAMEGLTAEQRLTTMRALGQPVAVGDVGGETVRGMARSVSNTSPPGRQILQDWLNPRGEESKNRFINFLQANFGAAETGAMRHTLENEGRPHNQEAYNTAYQAWNGNLWSPELERLMTSRDLANSVTKVAQHSGSTRAVAQGEGGFNPRVNITPDGRVEFNRGASGHPAYPDLQFWDYTYRDLRNTGRQLQQKGDSDAGPIFAVANQLKAELDRLTTRNGRSVYQEARQGAAGYFGAENAFEAGVNFAAGRRGPDGREFDNFQARRALASMTPDQRNLFGVGYASHLAGDTGNSTTAGIPRRYNTDRAFGSKMADRAEIALGGLGAQRMQAFMHFENLMDASARAVNGNSTTVRQMVEAGMAGGFGRQLGTAGVVGAGAGAALDAYQNSNQMTRDIAIGSLLAAGIHGGRAAMNQQVLRRIAEHLSSEDPTVIRRGLEMVTAFPWALGAIQQAQATLTRTLATEAAHTRTNQP